jgi:hypothetical protein
VRSEDGQGLARAIQWGPYRNLDTLPQYVQDYDLLLSWRIHERQKTNEEPTLSPFELKRHETEVWLQELWSDLVFTPGF